MLQLTSVLLVLSAFPSAESFESPGQKSDSEREPQSSAEAEPLENLSDFHYCQRNFALCGIVKKVEYSACPANSNACAARVNLNSACIRCETCLAIVGQINQTLIMLHKRVYPISHLNDTQIDALFKIICEYSFTNYALRDIEGRRGIFDNVRDATLIVTNVDGQWGEHLKKRCNELTEEMGRSKLYNYWKRWWDADKANEEISGLQFVLCRNDGSLFRECKNIPRDYKQDLKNIENDRLKSKIFNLFPCT